MNKKFRIFSLVLSALVLVVVLCFVSCKKKKEESKPWVSPKPENDSLPESVLPKDLYATVSEYLEIYSGDNPPAFSGQFVSIPHTLLFSNYMENANDTIGSVYNDRYVAFYISGGRVDFYGKQWYEKLYHDSNGWHSGFYEEVYRGLSVVGDNDNFTFYYFTEGYPNGLYAKQSTIFSGRWNDSLGGIENFQTAIVLLETSGNDSLAPVNSFRVLGDGDGFSEYTEWMNGKCGDFGTKEMSDEAAFRMFRIK